LKNHPETLTWAGIDLAALQHGEWTKDKQLTRRLREHLLRLAARYLLQAKQASPAQGPYDPVARFHLGNGARIERINWLADTSIKGFRQSLGLMVNYVYDPEEIETNVEAFANDGKITASASLRRLART